MKKFATERIRNFWSTMQWTAILSKKKSSFNGIILQFSISFQFVRIQINKNKLLWNYLPNRLFTGWFFPGIKKSSPNRSISDGLRRIPSFQGPLSSQTLQIGLETQQKKTFELTTYDNPSPKVAFTRWFITHSIDLQRKSYPAIWISVSKGRRRWRRGRWRFGFFVACLWSRFSA